MARKLTQEEFIQLANSVHNNVYSYDKAVYTTNRNDVTITCKLHGDFQLKANKHTSAKRGCPLCIKRKTKEEFIEESRAIHGDTYVYNNTNYISWKYKVTLTCRKHGDFEVSPNRHIRDKMGCKQCSKKHSGWSDTNWKMKGLTSKHFESYKVYVIRCFNEHEEFIKIGKTFLNMTKRFHNNGTMPYKYEILKIIESEDAKKICHIEREMQKDVDSFHYTPELKFHGSVKECYSIESINELDVSWLHFDTRDSDIIRLFKG